ncbi:NAD(P)H-dependent oxidoreductase [Gordonia rubripertincta]|nr:NAD(P)H-dependent oxidoreductase [Gordonia rubripertincta]
MEVGVLVGSLRRESVNRKLASAMASLVPERLSFTEVALGELPMYNGDLEPDRPSPVEVFTDKIRGFDAILMVMPEYNRSVPAVLKNAIDWGSKPPHANAWLDKPVALTGISPGAISTAAGQLHLRQVLGALGAAVLGGEAYLSTRSEPFRPDGTLQDSAREFLGDYLNRFADFAGKLRTTEAAR